MIKNVLFDMDGTLLPMDQDEFVNGYFRILAKKVAPFGYKPDELVAGIWKGTKAMVVNDGSRTNEEAFWDVFLGIFGEQHRAEIEVFDEFYKVEFNQAKDICGFQPLAAPLVKDLKERGMRVILATNPLFPMVGQLSRIGWTGIDPEDFEYITSYENSHYCKPNPMYFKELADKLGLKPEECIVIGNDAAEDTAALELGMKVYLVTDCLLNRDGRDISIYDHGTFEEMAEYLRQLV